MEGEHGDAGAVDALYVRVAPSASTVSPDLGGTPEGAQDVAADGVEVLVGEVEVEVLVDLGDGDAAVYGVEAVAYLLDGGLALVELVLDLPDDLLEDVLYRDQSPPQCPTRL